MKKTQWLTATSVPMTGFIIAVIVNLISPATTLSAFVTIGWLYRTFEVLFAFCLIMVVKKSESLSQDVSLEMSSTSSKQCNTDPASM